MLSFKQVCLLALVICFHFIVQEIIPPIDERSQDINFIYSCLTSHFFLIQRARVAGFPTAAICTKCKDYFKPPSKETKY